MRKPKCKKWWKVFLHDANWKAIDKTRVATFTRDEAKELGRQHWKLENSEHITVIIDVLDYAFLFCDDLKHTQINQDQQPKPKNKKTL